MVKKKYNNIGSKIITRLAKPSGTGAHVIIPKKWMGKKVAVVLEPIDIVGDIVFS